MNEYVDSKIVTANLEYGSGIALYSWGLLAEMNHEAGCSLLSDMWLDDAPPGIYVWEGHVIFDGPNYEGIDEGDFTLDGEFRVPTKEEWQYIMKQESPFREKYEGLV